MERFAVCLKFVLAREGGYVNHKSDRGGATNQGVTQRVYDEWRERKGSVPQSVEYIAPAEVYAIYNEQYWRPVRAEILPQPLDLVMFDSAVQHGPSRAVMFLQQTLNVEPVSGHFGPITLDAMLHYVEQNDAGRLAEEYLKRRDRFYDAIIANDPTQRVFAKGWDARMSHLRDVVFA